MNSINKITSINILLFLLYYVCMVIMVEEQRARALLVTLLVHIIVCIITSYIQYTFGDEDVQRRNVSEGFFYSAIAIVIIGLPLCTIIFLRSR